MERLVEKSSSRTCMRMNHPPLECLHRSWSIPHCLHFSIQTFPTLRADDDHDPNHKTYTTLCFHRLEAHLDIELDSAIACHSGFSLFSVLHKNHFPCFLSLRKPGLANPSENHTFPFTQFGSFHLCSLILAKQVDFGKESTVGQVCLKDRHVISFLKQKTTAFTKDAKILTWYGTS